MRVLVDTLGCTYGYNGPAVALNIHLDEADIKKNPESTSASYLAKLRRQLFTSDQEFSRFFLEFVNNKSGSSLNGRLTWTS